MRESFGNFVATYWRPALYYGALVGVVGALFWFRLGTLTGGYSADELATLQASSGLRHIWDNPVNAPFTLLAYGLLYLGHHGLFFMRIAATVFGLLTLSIFFWLVRYWHGERSAIFGTIVFGCSAWFLHTARLGTPDVLLFMLLALAACAIWLKRTNSPVVLLLGFLLAASLLYVPGMVWLIVLGVLWQWRTIDRIFKRHLAMVSVGGLAMLAIIAPLGWAIYRSPQLAKVLAGLPAQGWPQPMDSLHRLALVPFNLFIRGPLDAQHWLGRLPVLDAFTIVMLGLGAYVYLRHWRLARVKLMATILILSGALICLGGAISLTILIPFIYVLIAAGIGLMLDRWYAVFPRNAIAQTVGIGLISLAVLATSWYGVRHYFIAWPNAPATRATFVANPK